MNKPSILLCLLLITSCVKETTNTSTEKTSGNDPVYTGSSSGGTTTGTTSSSTSGGSSTCYGNTQDGDGSGNAPLQVKDIQLAGKHDWIPVNGTPPDGQISYDLAQIFLNSVDNVLKVRAKVLAQPSTCPQKDTGSPTYPLYTKLRFKIRFYHLNQQTNELEPTQFFYEPENPISVDSCSQIFDIPYKTEISLVYAGPVVMGVEDVRSDFECQFHGEGGTTPRCPAEKEVTSNSCWRIKLQWATDATDNFN